jgi:5-methylcytosine-specific restriction endonuclease McrA
MAKEGLVPKTGKRKTDLQIDHIIPYRQGFDLNISPEIMGGNKNLRFILGEENRKKWDNYQSLAVVQHVIGSSILAEDAIKAAINDYKSKTNLS